MIGTTFTRICESLLGGIHIGHSASRVKLVDGKTADWVRGNLHLVLAWLERDCTDRGIPWVPRNAERIINVAIRKAARRYVPPPPRARAIRHVKPSPPPGVGSEVKRLCTRVGLASCVTCDSKSSEWDAKGLAWCAGHRGELVAWLVGQARKRNISFATSGALLAMNEPAIAASVAAAVLVHPLTDVTELAVGCVVDHAIELVRARRPKRLPVDERIPIVITACKRTADVQRRTAVSVVNAGFSDIHACCEPGTDEAALSPAIIHRNTKQLGQWRNLIQALRIGVETGASHFVTMEDDVELCRQSLSLIHRLGWPPDCGCVQLYSAARYGKVGGYPYGARTQLRVEQSLDMLGCCALMFSRAAAIELIQWADEKGWRGGVDWNIDTPGEKKAGDTFVGEVLTFRKLGIWIYNPSIADHIGIESTLGNGVGTGLDNRRPLHFPGIDADLLTLFGSDLR